MKKRGNEPISPVIVESDLKYLREYKIEGNKELTDSIAKPDKWDFSTGTISSWVKKESFSDKRALGLLIVSEDNTASGVYLASTWDLKEAKTVLYVNGKERPRNSLDSFPLLQYHRCPPMTDVCQGNIVEELMIPLVIRKISTVAKRPSAPPLGRVQSKSADYLAM